MVPSVRSVPLDPSVLWVLSVPLDPSVPFYQYFPYFRLDPWDPLHPLRTRYRPFPELQSVP